MMEDNSTGKTTTSNLGRCWSGASEDGWEEGPEEKWKEWSSDEHEAEGSDKAKSQEEHEQVDPLLNHDGPLHSVDQCKEDNINSAETNEHTSHKTREEEETVPEVEREDERRLYVQSSGERKNIEVEGNDHLKKVPMINAPDRNENRSPQEQPSLQKKGRARKKKKKKKENGFLTQQGEDAKKEPGVDKVKDKREKRVLKDKSLQTCGKEKKTKKTKQLTKFQYCASSMLSSTEPQTKGDEDSASILPSSADRGLDWSGFEEIYSSEAVRNDPLAAELLLFPEKDISVYCEERHHRTLNSSLPVIL